MQQTAPVIIQFPEGLPVLTMLAYLDASTGGLIIQTLIAAAVAIPFILRTQVARGLAMLRRRGQPADQQEARPQDD